MASIKRPLIFLTIFGLMSMVLFSACTSTPASTNAEKQAEKKVVELIPGATGPVISFENLEHDFGQVAAGDETTNKYVFVNCGSETLVIEKVRAG